MKRSGFGPRKTPLKSSKAKAGARGPTRGAWINRTTKGAKPRKPVKARNPERREKEFARCYGSKERVAFVKSLACVAWRLGEAEARRCAGPIDNMHTEGGGAGRKADAATIAPGCRHHHRAYDEHRAPFDTPLARRLVREEARSVEFGWQSYRQAHVQTRET